MSLFIRTDLDIHKLAEKIRYVLNCREFNGPTQPTNQCRDSLNRGGEYYCLESAGMCFNLQHNKGEVAMISEDFCSYWIDLETPFWRDQKCEVLVLESIVELLKREGLDAGLADPTEYPLMPD